MLLSVHNRFMHKKVFLLTVFFLVTACCFTYAGELSPYSEIILTPSSLMGFGKHLFEEKEYYRAITELKRFLFLFPKNQKADNARLLIAKSYYNGNMFEECADYLEKCRIDNSDVRVESVFLLGDCYVKMENYKIAKNTFKMIIDEHPGGTAADLAFTRIARLHLIEGEWEAAAEAYKGVKNNKKMAFVAKEAAKAAVHGKEIPSKSPVVAGILSALLPGAGHLYVGRKQDAFVALMLNGGFIWGIIESFRSDKPVVGGILSFFEFGWYAGSINGSVNSAYKYNKKKENIFRNNMKKFKFSFDKSQGGRNFLVSWHFDF